MRRCGDGGGRCVIVPICGCDLGVSPGLGCLLLLWRVDNEVILHRFHLEPSEDVLASPPPAQTAMDRATVTVPPPPLLPISPTDAMDGRLHQACSESHNSARSTAYEHGALGHRPRPRRSTLHTGNNNKQAWRCGVRQSGRVPCRVALDQ